MSDITGNLPPDKAICAYCGARRFISDFPKEAARKDAAEIVEKHAPEIHEAIKPEPDWRAIAGGLADSLGELQHELRFRSDINHPLIRERLDAYRKLREEG